MIFSDLKRRSTGIVSAVCLYLIAGQLSATRIIEVTEKYDAWEYSYTGYFANEGSEVQAIVRAPSGESYRVRTGNYIGKDAGKIIEIDRRYIHIRERMPICDRPGEWAEIENYIMAAGQRMDPQLQRSRQLRIRRYYDKYDRASRNCLTQ